MVLLPGSRSRLKKSAPALVIAAVAAAAMLAPAVPAFAAPRPLTDAPGAPGAAATWTTGDKEGLGTSPVERLEGLVHPHRRDDQRGLLPERGHPERAGAASSLSPTARLRPSSRRTPR